MTYQEYLRKVEEFVDAKATSGINQSESLIKYTQLNFRRMSRLNKTIRLDEEVVRAVEALDKKMKWLVITEAWCGDAAQNIPYIAKLAESSENVELRLVYRDENPDYMYHYLTNGSKSIPKLIAYDDSSGDELFIWGPRPLLVQNMVMEYKAQMNHEKLPFDQFSEKIHHWYFKDKNETLKKELLHIFRNLD